MASFAAGQARPQCITSNDAPDYHPKWHPDGKSILFTSQRGGRTGIWSISATGGNAVPIETGMTGDHHISWSPDGRRIAFDARERGGPPNIWIMSFRGKDRKKLLKAGPNFHPAWSPDGSKIAFASIRTGRPGIRVISSKGGEPKELTRHDATEHHPCWSPDGSRIIYASKRSGNFDLWTVSAEGGDPIRITNQESNEDHPCFSPDGSMIAFTSDEGEEKNIWIKSLESGHRIKVTKEANNIWPAWSPDGDRLAYASSKNGNLDIWIVNIEEEVTELHGLCKNESESKRKSAGPVSEFGSNIMASHDKYLGEPHPGSTPKVFGEGIVSTKDLEFGMTVSPCGRRMLFTRRPVGTNENRIYSVEYANGHWSKPESAPFSHDCRESEPNFSPDGRRLYFNSRRPLPQGLESKLPFNVWVVELPDDHWGEPRLLGDPISTIFPMFVTETRSGTIYTTGCLERGIYKSSLRDGQYDEPIRLPDTINALNWAGHPYISPDESFLLFDVNVDDQGRKNLFISFRGYDGSWSIPINLSKHLGFSAGAIPHVTFDGKFLFFSCQGDIYWVDAGIINDLK